MAVSKLTENTLIPVSLVVVVVGAVLWLSSIYAQSKETSERLVRIEQKQETYVNDVESIDRRLSRIEGKLGLADLEK